MTTRVDIQTNCRTYRTVICDVRIWRAHYNTRSTTDVTRSKWYRSKGNGTVTLRTLLNATHTVLTSKR